MLYHVSQDDICTMRLITFEFHLLICINSCIDQTSECIFSLNHLLHYLLIINCKSVTEFSLYIH
jgi:hypothetical protein